MTSTSDIDSLDQKITTTDLITICALIVTLVAAIFAFYFRGEQNNLLKSQRQKDQIQIAESNARSESAKRDASIATERAELAVKDAAIANEHAAKSNERAAQAELRSKELEIELLQLRLAVGDRFLPDNIVQALKSELKKYPNKTVLIYCAVSNDSEPLDFSKKLSDFFTSIGWKSKVQEQQNVVIPAPTGVKIHAIGESNRKIANFIVSQFKSLNYECYEYFEKEGQGDLIIQVLAH